MSGKTEAQFLDNNVAYLPDQGVLIMEAALEIPVTAATAPKPKNETAGLIFPWGDDNNLPQQIISLAAKGTELASLLDWKARALQGREIIPVQLVWDDVKKDFVEERINDEEINAFFSHRTFKRYCREAAVDFNWFWNIFPDLIKNGEGTKIAYLGTHDASMCRWGVMNNDGVIEKCYVAGNWPDAKADEATTIEVDVIDPYDPEVIDKLKASKIGRFVYPVSYPSPGKSYYQLAPWDGYRISGWPEVAQMTPKSKAQLMKFMLSAKFILEIPVNYWNAVHKDWEKKTPEQQLIIKKEKVAEINATLTGVDNAGKTIMFEVGTDQAGREIAGWKVIPIEDKLKDGANLQDSREASQHLRSALNLDSALTGEGPGTGMGAGSGSDKRVALNIYVALQQPYREVIYEPIYFIAEYNGWLERYPNFRLKTVEIQLETLDKSHQTSKTVTN